MSATIFDAMVNWHVTIPMAVEQNPALSERWDHVVPSLIEEAEMAQVIDATNVHTYLLAMGSGYRSSDYTMARPPFPTTWVEWRMPTVSELSAYGKDIPSHAGEGAFATRVGVLVIDDVESDMFGDLSDVMGEDVPPSRMAVFVFGTIGNGRCSGPYVEAMIPYDPDTGIVATQEMVVMNPNMETEGADSPFIRASVPTMLMTFSFMHCKNVSIIDAPDTRSRQQRRYDDRHGTTPTVFKTLVIDPSMSSATTRKQKPMTADEHKKRLHIVRGHFSTYTEDRPLFGKYAGRFWIPSHIRGSADIGSVEKTYEVHGRTP